MCIGRMLACGLIGSCALLLAIHGINSRAQEKVADKLKAENVLKEWEYAKAAINGPYWPRNEVDPTKAGHADLASEWFTLKVPMEKVWRYYADKCGHKKQFPGQGSSVVDGTGKENARYLMNFKGGSERNKSYRCTLAYNTDRYMVFVELASGWEDDSTLVNVTVGIR